MRRRLLVVVTGVLLAGGGWVAGQQTPPTQPMQPTPLEPRILSGADIGFLVEGKTPEGVMGTLMVRLKNGTWVEAYGSPWRGRVVPLDAK